MTLRPSNAHRWANCSGSDRLESAFPEPEETAEAKEGTAGHFYATEALQGREVREGDTAPNGVRIDADMIEGGDVLIKEVRRVMSLLPGGRLYVETFCEAPTLIHPRVKGTPDTVYIHMEQRYLHVFDFKYGHKYVEEFRNAQGVNYIGAVFESAGITDMREIAGWQVVFTVVQPRYYMAAPVRHWRMTGGDVVQALAQMQQAAQRADDPNAECRAGPWCDNCQGVGACEALAKTAGIAIDMSGRNTPLDVSVPAAAKQLGTIKDAIARLEAMAEGLEARLTAEIKAAKSVPGWALLPASNREVWLYEPSSVIELGDAYGVDLRKKDAIMTPGQARKAGLDEGVMKLYSDRKPGALKLVRADSNQAAKAFGNG